MSSFLVVLEEYQPSAAPIEIVPLFDVTDCPVFSGPLGHVHKALYPGLFGIAWNIPCHMSILNDHSLPHSQHLRSISCQPASKDPHLGTNGNNTRLVIHASSRMWIHSICR